MNPVPGAGTPWLREVVAVKPLGAQLLDDVYEFIGRFVSYPSDHHRRAHALWIAHTHLMGAWESTPRIAFLSPEPASGKTRALEITELLVPRPVSAVNVSVSYLFRKVADKDGAPTLLYDEIDTVFGPRAKENEEIRGLLNAGHRRGAVAGRCIAYGSKIVTEELPAFCAVAMAGLGKLPDTILTRSVILPMKRRAPDEIVQQYRRRLHAPEGERLRQRLDAWAGQVGQDAQKAMPDMPDGVADRDGDVWEAMLAIADLAGGDWPAAARVTAVTLVTLSKRGGSSLGIRLLTDIKTVFGYEKPLARDPEERGEVISTAKLLAGLIAIEESPWGDYYGKAFTSRNLSGFLKEYEIKSGTVRLGDNKPTVKGYYRKDFLDAWKRYLPSQVESKNALAPSPIESVTSVTSVTNGEIDPDEFNA